MKKKRVNTQVIFRVNNQLDALF